MKKILQPVIRMSACALMLTLSSMTGAWAQKLNNIQQGSVRAPAKVKIDAKLNEWPDTLQAYNRTTDLFYTIANDENNLYLVMKSTSQATSSKIIGGGINFTINTTNGKKKQKDDPAFVIKFPIVDMANLQNMIMQRMRSQNGQPQPLDSEAVANIRRDLIKSIKQIGLSGFKDISDSSISIYNEYQIKAAVDIDNKNNLIIEIALPLKYLHISANTSLAYNIRLNGIQLNFRGAGQAPPQGGFQGGGNGGGFQGGGGNFGGGRGNFGGGGGMPRGMGNMAAMLSPTDFSGKYTLASKK